MDHEMTDNKFADIVKKMFPPLTEEQKLRHKIADLNCLLKNEHENYRREYYSRIAAEKDAAKWEKLYFDLKELYLDLQKSIR